MLNELIGNILLFSSTNQEFISDEFHSNITFRTAVEAKSRVRANDLRSMRAFVEECAPRRAIVVSAEEDRRMVDGIEIMSHSHFLELLHEGEIL